MKKVTIMFLISFLFISMLLQASDVDKLEQEKLYQQRNSVNADHLGIISIPSRDAGDILSTIYPAMSPWGMGYDGEYLWFTDAIAADTNIHQYDTDGNATGLTIDCSAWMGSWIGDMANEPGYIYAVNVGGDNNIYKLDAVTGAVEEIIGGAWNSTSARGLALDPATGDFYIGGWNHTEIYHVAHDGSPIATIPFASVSGLAWHPLGNNGSGSLWVTESSIANNIYELDPSNGAILQQFASPGADYACAGLAIDHMGNLWAIDQGANSVNNIDSGVPMGDPAAPGAPTDFAIVPDAGGALSADLSWTCPAVTIDGSALTELTEMQLWRGEDLVYTDSSPTIGGTGSYEDMVPASGTYSYSLLGINSMGDGLPAMIGSWIGEDVPNVVTGLVLVDQGGDGYLEWDNPTTGLNGGAFNEAILGHHIERSDGIVYESTGAQESYTDPNVPTGEFYYTVQAYNSVGDGGLAESNAIWFGEGSIFNVFIQCDDYGSETTWDVVDDGGSVLFSGGPYAANEIVDFDCQLAEGDYVFTIYDAWGDGICCDYGNGYYTLTLDGTVIFDGNGMFATEEVTPFTVGSPADPGYIEGTVTLVDGAGDVEDVVVSAGGVTVNPDAMGDYMITIAPGTYDVMATLMSYSSDTVTGVVVTEGNITPGVDLTLTYMTGNFDPVENLAVDDMTGLLTWEVPGGTPSGLFEDFEGTFPPAGWHKISPDGGTGWEPMEVGTTPLPGWTGGEATACPDGGSWSAFCTYTTGGASSNDQWLVTPQVSVVTGDMLEFWLGTYFADQYADYVEILISTTVQTDVNAFDVVVATIDLTTPDGWTNYSYDLTSFVASGTPIYIAFREMVADNLAEGACVSIDNVLVGQSDNVLGGFIAMNPNTGNRDMNFTHIPNTHVVSSRDLTGYNVYLDDDLQGNTSDTEYLLTNLVYNTVYTAGVEAVYDDGVAPMEEVTFTYMGGNEAGNVIVATTNLGSNYPNPFNPVTNIAYSIKETGNVAIEVYNMRGQLVKTLINEVKETGNHTISWNGTDNSSKSVSSGVYFYKMVTESTIGRYTSTKKMILMK